MWQPGRTTGTATSPRHSFGRRSISASSISSDDVSSTSIFSAPSRPQFVPAARTGSPTPLTSTQSSFNAGADTIHQHAKAHQGDAVYPDLSHLVRMTEEQHSWCSSAWVNLEMPGEEESRIWGAIPREPNEFPSTESVHPSFHPYPEPQVIQRDGNSFAAPQARGGEEYDFDTDSDEYDEFGGVTLDSFDEAEEIRGSEVEEATGSEVSYLEPSVQEPDTEVSSSTIFTADTEEDYDGEDDIDTLLQGT